MEKDPGANAGANVCTPGSHLGRRKTRPPDASATAPSSRTTANSGALVVNLCESNLRLAANLSSGGRRGGVQVLANTLAAHERAAHRPTETHNGKMSLPESNQEAV